MKFFILFSIFISLPAFAGRESHGLMPVAAGFQCELENASEAAGAELMIEKRKVTHGTLKFPGQAETDLLCFDRTDQIRINDQMQLTVICTDGKFPGYRLELSESSLEAQALVYHTGFKTQKPRAFNLSCH